MAFCFSFRIFRLSLIIFFLIAHEMGVLRGPQKAVDFDCFRAYPTASTTSSSPSSISLLAFRYDSMTSSLTSLPFACDRRTFVISAPNSSNVLSACRCPFLAAWCTARFPPLSAIERSTSIFFTKYRNALVCPPAAAAWHAVHPTVLTMFTSTPRTTAAFRPVISPRWAYDQILPVRISYRSPAVAILLGMFVGSHVLVGSSIYWRESKS
mmetsp:Transcript_14461/g.36307  ORF Transcript_14461/g.36307 Transcript_14461/m.36307 type:complete len:210 (-) Transcript_14461:29-658(-)